MNWQRGLAQATAAAKHLSGKESLGVRAIYSSDLLRASKTADMIAEELGWKEDVSREPLLQEWNMGILQATTPALSSPYFRPTTPPQPSADALGCAMAGPHTQRRPREVRGGDGEDALGP